MPLHRHYSDLQSIRTRSGWILLSARRRADDTRCVLLAPGREADVAHARDRLDAIERAHATIDHPLVPKVGARRTVADRPVLELACDGVADGLEVMRRLGRSRTRLPYPAADAFIVSLRKAMQAAHAVDLRLGRMSGANVLFAESGRWYLVGFGANFPTEDEHGTPDGALPFFQAPEVAMGAPPSPIGDYVALVMFMRSQLGHIDPGGPLGRVLQATLQSKEPVLTETIRWIEQRLFGELPARRATIAEAVAMADRIRGLLGVTLDPDGFQKVIARLMTIDPDTLADPPQRDALTLGPDGEWIGMGETDRRPLRGASRRIALALFEHHMLGASSALRSVDLVELGWPDETPEYESGLNRVYVTMNRLKKLFPDGAIQRFDDGYRLSPDLTVGRSP